MWKWSVVELMLVEYSQHENLYNVRHRDYQDRVKRAQSLFAIYEKIKAVDPNVTLDGVKTKVHGLRSQYLKEVNRVKASKKSGAGRDDVYEPKLWCFSLLQFLAPYVTTRPSSSNLSDSINKENESSGMNVDQEEDEEEDFFNDSLPGTSQSSMLEASTPSPLTSRPSSSAKKRKQDVNFCNDSLPGTSQSSVLEASTPSPLTSRPSSSSKKRKQDVALVSEQINLVRSMVTKRLSENNDYEYVLKQVDSHFRRITDNAIKDDMAWKIQNILREGLLEYNASSRGTTQAPAAFSSNPSRRLLSTPIHRPIPVAAMQKQFDIMEHPDDIMEHPDDYIEVLFDEDL